MERVLSQNEKIRRAEEIYARRKMQTEPRQTATVSVDSRNNNRLTKKLIRQFIICAIIYATFYAIKNIPNLVPQEIMYKISDVLEYDINIQDLYKNIINSIKKDNNEDEQDSENGALLEETLAATDVDEIAEEQNNLAQEENSEATEQDTSQAISEEEENVGLSQMEIDAKYIKANCVIMKPLEGEITSRFGPRNPEIATVPKYHTGIDIARVTGTVIPAAMEGTVELVSSEGDLRKSHKDNKWRSIHSICALQ